MNDGVQSRISRIDGRSITENFNSINLKKITLFTALFSTGAALMHGHVSDRARHSEHPPTFTSNHITRKPANPAQGAASATRVSVIKLNVIQQPCSHRELMIMDILFRITSTMRNSSQKKTVDITYARIFDLVCTQTHNHGLSTNRYSRQSRIPSRIHGVEWHTMQQRLAQRLENVHVKHDRPAR